MYTVPSSVDSDRYTTFGMTMCSWEPSEKCRRQYSSTCAAVIFPLFWGRAITLWPVASTEPVSWTAMWPVSAEITP